MDVSSPPPYRRLSRQGQAPQSGSELPRYTRRNTLAQPVAVRREATEHVYHLVDGRSRPWLSLKVYSSAKSTKSLPTFFEKENINATLEVHADKGDSSIQAITAIVTGRIITGARSDETITFLTLVHPIWSKSLDGPRTPSSSEGASGSKLFGDCVWSFSISLPKTIDLSKSGSEPVSYRLPETFLERHLSASIQYDLAIHVSRGKLRADSQIKTPFGYVPCSRPEQPTMLRQLAYEQHQPLPNPFADPEGWKTSMPFIARGLLFQNRKTEIQCSFSLAKPLCYTRGSVLPCFLSLSSRDTQALDMITSSSAIDVCLRRRVGYCCSPGVGKKNVAWQESFLDVGHAVWWPSATTQSDLCNRHLEGEIRLPKDLKPTSAMSHFSISYFVEMQPFATVGLTPDSPAPLLSEPVDIATMYARGARPLAYSPPAYDPISRTNDDFYATLR